MNKALELIRTLIDGANEYEKKTGNTNPTVYLSKNNLLVIQQALLKAQEPKQYLKWEDLEFTRDEQKINILMSGNAYYLYVYREEYVEIRAIDGWHLSVLDGGYPKDIQFFNDLHLERVEE